MYDTYTCFIITNEQLLQKETALLFVKQKQWFVVFYFACYGIWCRIFLKGWILIRLLPFLKNKQLNRGFVIGGLKFFSPQRTWVVVQLTDKVSSRVTLQKIFFFGEVHWVVLRKKKNWEFFNVKWSSHLLLSKRASL